MTWTFGGDPSTSPRDAVRLYVGDTDPADQLVTDETIAWALGLAGQNAVIAAARIARMIAMTFARGIDSTVGDVKVVFSNRAKLFAALTEDLEGLAGVGASAGTGGLIVEPVVTGVSVGEMDAVAQNPDRPGSPWPEFEGAALDGVPLHSGRGWPV